MYWQRGVPFDSWFQQGFLICTPDHLLKQCVPQLKNKSGWLQARDCMEPLWGINLGRAGYEYQIIWREPYGVRHVYDLTVDQYHNFITNELCVHNCVAEHTPITTVGGTKPIEELQHGDLLYCYDSNGELQIRPLVERIDQGIKPCVRVNWRSRGSNPERHGSLVCTPDHKLLTTKGEWVEAQYSKGLSIVHLTRSQSADLRPFLHGWHGLHQREQKVIKEKYFNCYDPSMDIHHIDGDMMNNDVSNLRIMTRSQHHSLHARELVAQGRIRTDHLRQYKPRVYHGAEHHSYIHKTVDELRQMVIDAKGRITDVPLDFQTFKDKCAELGYDYKQDAAKYNPVHYGKKVITEEQFCEAYLEANGKAVLVQQQLGISRYQYDKCIHKYGRPTNHIIESVEMNAGYYHVYDLHVKEIHNFIANELTLKNCSRPNNQNLPRGDTAKGIKNMFVPRYEGYCLMQFDLSQAELRGLGSFSHDPNLKHAYDNGLDLHKYTAANMWHNGDLEQVSKHERSIAKTINFATVYGANAPTIAANAGISVEEAEAAMKKWLEFYSCVQPYMDHQGELVESQGFVTGLWGLKRNLPMVLAREHDGADLKRQAGNSGIQNFASDFNCFLMLIVMDYVKQYNLRNEIRMVNTVHDSIVFEVKGGYESTLASFYLSAMDQMNAYCAELFGEEYYVKMRGDCEVGLTYGDLYEAKIDPETFEVSIVDTE